MSNFKIAAPAGSVTDLGSNKARLTLPSGGMSQADIQSYIDSKVAAMSPTIYTHEHVLPGCATSALQRLEKCPAGKRWEVTVGGRPLIAAAEIMAGLLISQGTPAFPKSGATIAAAGPGGTNGQVVLTPRGPFKGSSPQNPIWWTPGASTPQLLGDANHQTAQAGMQAYCVSPDGRWLFASATNLIYAFPLMRLTPANTDAGNGFSATPITAPVSAPTVGTTYSIDVSPDGHSVVLGGGTSPYIEAWAFDPDTGAWGAKASNPASLPQGAVNSVRFSPDGTMIAAALNASPYCGIWAWTGTAFGNRASNPATLPLAAGMACDWHPASTYVTFGTGSAAAATNTRTYPVTGGATPAFGTVLSLTTGNGNVTCTGVAWAPDGSFMAHALSGTVFFSLFSGGAFGTSTSTSVGAGTGERAIAVTNDSLCVIGCNSNVTRSFMLPGSTSRFPDKTPFRTVQPVVANGITTYSNVTPIETITFAMAADEELWYQPDIIQSHIVDLFLTIYEYSV